MNQDNATLIEALETQRTHHSHNTSVSHKSDYGQYFTPSAVALFMASMFPAVYETDVKLLDPGAGIGSLSCAFVLNMNQRVQGVNYEIDCYETDHHVLAKLTKNLYELSSINRVKYTVLFEDFIEAAVDSLLQFNKPLYTHVIMNPPYKKIHSSSNCRKQLRSVDLEIVNLYSAFVSMSLELLKKDGYLVAIIPRSFCNGTYYLPFRKHVLSNAVIRRIHLFESRNSIFKNDSVLQENIIILLQKNDLVKQVEVSYSKDQVLESIKTIQVEYSRIVDLTSWELIINIPQENGSTNSVVTSDYRQIGCMVSTGPVVDFRNTEFISSEVPGKEIPLIYPQNICSFMVHWPSPTGLQKSIEINTNTQKMMYKNGYYVIVRRFSSKEEKRRIVAALYKPEDNSTEYIAFENHLNVFHNNGQGLEPDVAYGLVAYLNSEGFDEEFRVFSGHTQVNVSDLKRMKYPTLEQLKKLGRTLQSENFSYKVFEDIITEVLNHESR
ncbi:MAG: SAM-dependent methyltransferase [Candidatus Cloacimonetes bacterium HGW-Cloacimonetes-3]|jgi:adenine-specific DNA-methyltransferase|nr:MAG: SAM-dependent methyltransferase [Candidatus Cloacimonetes bacterium HGW-Cloacimonetes-3]